MFVRRWRLKVQCKVRYYACPIRSRSHCPAAAASSRQLYRYMLAILAYALPLFTVVKIYAAARSRSATPPDAEYENAAAAACSMMVIQRQQAGVKQRYFAADMLALRVGRFAESEKSGSQHTPTPPLRMPIPVATRFAATRLIFSSSAQRY